MPKPSPATIIDPKVLEEAAEWLMRLHDGELPALDRAALERWRDSSAECRRAWDRAEQLLGKFGGLPPTLALACLDRPASPERRAALAKLASLLALVPVGWGAWKLSEWQQWTADYRSLVGQQRHLTLVDGTRLILNTGSAVDIRFDALQRLVLLRRGEILVETAADNLSNPRPFLVSTAEGRMQALGTRFSVREEASRTQLAVLEGAVRVELASAAGQAPWVVKAGQRTAFSAQAFDGLHSVDSAALAWTQGMLLADKMRLADFVAELARYRSGFVRCDPAIADLPISGSFPVNDTSRALNMLVQTYPVQAKTHMNGYWVLLSPS